MGCFLEGINANHPKLVANGRMHYSTYDLILKSLGFSNMKEKDVSCIVVQDSHLFTFSRCSMHDVVNFYYDDYFIFWSKAS